jgi:uncharacterized membrane protein (DUF4010 family)
MELYQTFQQLGIALGLGLLVGLQRQHSEQARLAGLRTFPIVALLGAICALMARSFGGWIIAAGLLALAGIIIMGNMLQAREGTADPGLTTEAALLLMFGIGAYVILGQPEVAIASGGTLAALLQFKGQMHGVAAKLGDEDLKAIMQFALISLVILPILPNRAYGPYQVLNPRQIWWMVVLIVGISLSGYIAYKFFGQSASIALAGILGGLISSTATTIGYARHAAQHPESNHISAAVIMISSAVVFARVLLVVALVAPGFLTAVTPSLLALFALLAVLALAAWSSVQKKRLEMPPQENPSELRSALLFGLIYAVVLLATAAAKDRFGHKGLYLVAALSGLTDVDAITISTSQLVASDKLSAEMGLKLLLLALMANLIFKASVCLAVGGRQLMTKTAVYFLAAMIASIALLVFKLA